MPEFRERVWGTRDLRPVYTRVVGKEPIGEVWLTGDECKVANGPLAGTTLGELCTRHGRELVGDVAPDANRFPLLIKYLFPREKLSVQVHPDDEGARKIGVPCGKTECWYVARAMAGAQVGLGLKPGTTHEQFEKAIRENTAEHLLNWIDVKNGDMIYVDAGTVHAIGPNSILIETQQNSDTTYRLYDYGRGRELHVEQGLAAMRETTGAGTVEAREIDGRLLLLASPYFVVEKFQAGEPVAFTAKVGPNTAQVLVASEGCAIVECDGSQPVSFNQGEAVVIPAAVKQYTIRPQWTVEILRMMVPTENPGAPAARIPR